MKIRFWCDVPDPMKGGELPWARPYKLDRLPLRPQYRCFTFEVDFPVASTADAEEVEANEPEEGKG